MNQVAAPPPEPQRTGGGGCCGMGCLTLVLLLVFLALAFVGGGFWAAHHLSNKYTSPEPVELPEEDTSDAVAQTQSGTPVEQPPAPAPSVTPREVEERWKAFDKAADRNQKARIELSAAEINGLLQNNKNTRDKVFVSIENNVGHVRFSIPLKNVPMMKDRYLNGEVNIKASPDGDPAKAEISNIILSNQAVPDSMMDQRLFGWPSLRGAVSDWLDKQDIETFRIENNRVISETRGNDE
jgi:hypothetical protein